MTNHASVSAISAVYDDPTGAALFAVLAPDAVWHMPGASWMGGKHEGTAAVARLFTSLAQITNGSFSTVPRHIVGDDECVVSLVDASFSFRSRSFSTPVAVAWRFQDGRVVEVREHGFDMAGLDDFWADERPEGW
jgi:ketosteroid isomerase-like protein